MEEAQEGQVLGQDDLLTGETRETGRVTTPIVKTDRALTRTLGESFFLTLFIYWLHILLCTMAKC